MRTRDASIVTAVLLMMLLSLPLGEEASAMSLGRHHGDGGGSNGGSGLSARSTSESPLTSIDAQPYMTPVPEPSTIVLLASGIAGLGLLHLKRKD